MKTIFALAISLAVASAFQYQEEWEKWKADFDKKYESDMEELSRQIIWESNRVFVKNHNENADKFKFTVSMNEFADLDVNEFAQIYNGYRSDLKRNSSRLHKLSGQEPAASVDWREKGAVTEVKNQGQCGSCWSFSTTGSLEGQHFLKTGELIALSEQQLCDCSRSFGNNGCKGGLMDNAFRYLATVAGDELESDYPYTAEDSKYCKYRSSLAKASTRSHKDVPRESIEGLRDAVQTVGPISVAMDAGHQSFQLYHSGIYSDIKCSSTRLDHGVLAVGYGSEFGEKYWIVKNSWGTRWGMEGFFKITQSGNMCGIATQASYPTMVG